MEIWTGNHPDNAAVSIIRVKGRLDISGHDEFSDALNKLIDEGASSLIIDLQDVSYLGSGAVRVLVNARRRMEESGHRLILANLNTTGRKIMKVMEIDELFDIFDSVDGAMKGL